MDSDLEREKIEECMHLVFVSKKMKEKEDFFKINMSHLGFITMLPFNVSWRGF